MPKRKIYVFVTKHYLKSPTIGIICQSRTLYDGNINQISSYIKRIYLLNWIITLLAVVTLSSCSVEDLSEGTAPRLKVDKAIIQVIQTGKLKSGEAATLEVVANKGYKITSDAPWLNVSKPEGTGRVVLTVVCEPNETGAIREGHLTVASLDRTATVTVKQSLEEDTDDRLEIGHVYFYDDFAWAVGGSDGVGQKVSGDAHNIYTWDYAGNGFTSSLPTYQRLYEDLNANAKTCYTMDGYLKFDKTNTITAIAIRDLGITPGKNTSVKVSFKCARHGSDKCQIVVAVEGDGSITGSTNANGRVISPVVPMSPDSYTWTEVSVDITGISATSKIILGDITFVQDGINNSGTFRWYLDDLKVEKI